MRRHDNSVRVVCFATMTFMEDRESVEHLGAALKSGLTDIVWSVHDKDSDADGNPVKTHRHGLFHLNNAMTITAFAERFAINPAHVQIIGKGVTLDDDAVENSKAYAKYLIHADRKSKSLGKYQYPITSIVGPWEKTVREWLQELTPVNKEKKEASDITSLLDFIDNSAGLCMSDVMRYALDNGLYSSLRRSGALINQCLREHNEAWKNAEYKARTVVTPADMDIEVQKRKYFKARTIAARFGLLDCFPQYPFLDGDEKVVDNDLREKHGA